MKSTTKNNDGQSSSSSVDQQRLVPSKEYAYSIDNERYEGRFNTSKEAEKECEKEYPDRNEYWIGEVVDPPPPETHWDVQQWLENVACQEEYSGEWAEDWISDAFSVSKDAAKELEEKIQPLLAEWIKKHGLTPCFFNITNAKHVEL